MGRLGEILVDMKACTDEELRTALQTQAIFGGRIGTNLLELGLVDETQLAAALTKAHGLPCLSGDVEPEAGAIEALPAELVERYGAVPIHADERRLRVVISDPRDLPSLDELAFRTGKRVEPVLAPEARLWSLMRRFYGIDRRLRGLEVADELEDAATARGGRIGVAGLPGDGAPDGPRALSQREALDLLGQMRDPIVLSALLVRSAGTRAGRAVFLKVHGSSAISWLGAGPRLAGDVRGAVVALDDDGPFGAAAELRAPVIAPVRSSRGSARFLEALGGLPPMNALVAPVILRGRAVALLYADAGPASTLRDEVGDLLALAVAINRRFEALAPLAS